MKPVAAIVLAVNLFGCATSAVVYLQNAAGEMTRCGPYPASTATSSAGADAAARTGLNDCVSDYESKGYRTVPSPMHFPAAF